MNKINVDETKKKILEILEAEGPNLPLPIAKKLQMQPMFASAILSELMNEKRIKTSSMKVGSSPLYFIPEQAHRLEKFIDNLTGVEKEAYIKLRDNKLLSDEQQEPKIRVALRSIKDFAIPIQIDSKLYWKYLTADENKIREAMSDEGDVVVGRRTIGQNMWNEIKKDTKEDEKEIENIFDEKAIEKQKEENKKEDLEKREEIKEEKTIDEKPKKTKIKKITAKDLFLEQVKQIFKEKSIEILDLIQYDKKQVLAKARVEVDKTCILLFLDKKRPEEKDLMKAYKKSIDYKLPYYIMTAAGPTKKLEDSKKMYDNLLGFGSVE